MASAAAAFKVGKKVAKKVGKKVVKKTGKAATNPTTYMAGSALGLGISANKRSKNNSSYSEPAETGSTLPEAVPEKKTYYNQMSGSNAPSIKTHPGVESQVGAGMPKSYKTLATMQGSLFEQMERGFNREHKGHKRKRDA